MGGDVAVTLRMPSGKEHRMICSTNSVPYWLGVMFSAEDIEEYFKPFVEARMKRNKDDGYFDNLSPVCYGLIVCDFQTKTILSSNRCVDIGDFICLLGNKNENALQLIEKKKFHSFELNWTDLNQEKKTIVLSYGSFTGSRPEAYQNITLGEYLTSFISYDDFLDYLISLRPKMLDESNERIEFRLIMEIDTRPFNVIEYKNNRLDVLRMREKVKELGFKLSQEEEEGWHVHFINNLNSDWSWEENELFHGSVELVFTKLKKLFSTRWGRFYVQWIPWSRHRISGEAINRIQRKEGKIFSDEKEALEQLKKSLIRFLTNTDA